MNIRQELFVILTDKHPVIVLKDVAVKYLVLMLEYIYCGQVDLEPADVREFNNVAKSLKINVEFKVPEEEIISTVSSTHNDHSTASLISDESQDSSFGSFKGNKSLAKSRATVASLNPESRAPLKRSAQVPRNVKSVVPSKKEIRDAERVKQAKAEGWPKCNYCRKTYRSRDCRYHERFCWENPGRVVSDCKVCNQKFDVPTRLRNHMSEKHPVATPAAANWNKRSSSSAFFISSKEKKITTTWSAIKRKTKNMNFRIIFFMGNKEPSKKQPYTSSLWLNFQVQKTCWIQP